MTYSSEVLADSPLGYWRFSESAVPTVSAVTASSNFSSEPPSAANDAHPGTFWTTNGTSSGWLRYQLAGASVVTTYAISRRNDIPNRNPKTWTFEGSNDGSSWTVLDTQTNITWPTADEVKTFNFANSTAYLYYRLNISANNGDTYLSVADLYLYALGLADSSGNGRDASRSGTVVTGATGLLTGDSSAAISVTGGAHALVPFGSWMQVSSWTVECLAKPTAVSGLQTLMAQDTIGAGGELGWRLRLNDATVEVLIQTSSGTTTVSGPTVTAGSTHHYAVTWDGTTLRIYLDGTQVATGAPGGSQTLVSTPIRVGSLGSSFEPFGGTLDEAAFYGSALSSSRVADHYAAATGSTSHNFAVTFPITTGFSASLLANRNLAATFPITTGFSAAMDDPDVPPVEGDLEVVFEIEFGVEVDPDDAYEGGTYTPPAVPDLSTLIPRRVFASSLPPR